MANKNLWIAPKIWPGATCFILGGGPSLAKIDIERLHGQHVIAVNNAYQLADWIDVMFFGDCRWFSWHQKELIGWPGLKVSACESLAKKHKWLRVMKKRNSPWGISTNPALLTWNLNSGGCAINLAYHFGVKKIVLLGFDMRAIDGQKNWHVDHKDSPNKSPYERFMKTSPSIKADLDRLSVECVNATPGSALRDFPIVEPEEVLP